MNEMMNREIMAWDKEYIAWDKAIKSKIEKVEKEYGEPIFSLVDKYPVFFSCVTKLASIHLYGIEYVYFLMNKDTKLTKIGRTSDLKQRIKSIKQNYMSTVGVDPVLELIALIPCYRGTSSTVEKEVHAMFKTRRRFGEWFDLSKEEYLYELLDYEISLCDVVLCSPSLFDKNCSFNIRKEIGLHDIEAMFGETEYINSLLEYANKRFLFCSSKNALLQKSWSLIDKLDAKKDFNIINHVDEDFLNDVLSILKNYKVSTISNI